MKMAFRGQIHHLIGFYVKFRVYIGPRYIYDIYMSAAAACTPPLKDSFSKVPYICMFITTYIYLIILDADFDEDSDSDLRLEIGAHLDLVFEG